ncbi:transglutaminase domain-containing protein [Cohnella thermotolerans]|uniref:transglutaminase domain-containing protein n=1 Tax=Cohnella thermotolerans TaxID=329858 RepID=UPI0004129FED|nr:transglutaminase domain-containing protein [Cohnella thermotolerans]
MANNQKRWKWAAIPGLALALLLTGTSGTGLPPDSAAEAATASGATGAQATLADTIFAKLRARSAQFAVQTAGSASASLKAADQAFGTAMKRDDYVNYTIKSYSFSSKSDGKKATVTVKVTYWENAAQSAYVAAKSKEILASIIKPGMNDHQKVKAIHDWVLLHVAYDRTLRKHSAYDALASGQAVCQGYASLTYRLLTDAGLQARIAEGTVKTGPHAWNLVKLDGKWYHLDTTFDDPVPDVAGRTEYGYYLTTDAQMRRDHSWTLAYPSATTSYAGTLAQLQKSDPARKAFYTGLYETLGYLYLQPDHTVRNEQEIAAQIKQAIREGRTSVKVRYAQGASRKLDLQKLLDAVPAIAKIQSRISAFPPGDPGDALLELQFTLAKS